MVELISEIGPDIPEVARRLGQYKESVRYRYKEKILEKGFAVQAAIDHEKLGLKRVVVTGSFAEPYRQYAQPILVAMNEFGYVVYFEKRLVHGDYVIEASVPSEFVRGYEGFLMELKAKGIFTALDVLTYDWFRNVPMRAEFYDFDTGRWDFDWSTTASSSGEAASYVPSQPAPFDYVDLLILKELQVDASRPMVETARKLKINYKKLVWHYHTHVLAQGLVKGYNLRWMGTRYDYKLERALHRMHRYLQVDLLARSLSGTQRMELARRCHELPFLWSEAVGEADYYSRFFFPIDNVTEALQHLTNSIASLNGKAEVMIMDQTEALSFSISYQLFDESSGAWTFSVSSLLSRFDTLIEKIKEVGRTG